MRGASTAHNPIRPTFTFIYRQVHTSQETHLRVFTACYVNSFTFLYVDHVHTSQETRPVTAMASSFYIVMMFVPQRKHFYGPPRPATGLDLFSSS
jgi:hypothetical protein